jgi:steroid 5-alpha reductase family enzyme
MTLLLIIVLIACSLLMVVAWRVQQSSGNSSWVDVAWTFGTGLAGIALTLTPLHHAPLTVRQIVVSVIVAIWSLRLGIHIMRRALRGKDDPRYAKLKESWGDSYGWKMPGFLQLQALSVFMLACFIMLAGRNPAPGFVTLDVLALLVAVLSIGGEAISDEQVHRFASDPANKGKICEAGLWGWSRHPNYFFEWLIWVAYALFAIAGFGSGSDWGWGWIAWLGPVVMYLVLVHASGIPPTEEHMLQSRGEAFRDYQRRVSKFVPLPPKAPAKARIA